MYTYTEADNYNEKGNQLYSKMDEVFEQTINNNGWLIKAKNTLNQQEREWMQDFHKVTPEEAIQFGEDIYTVNIESGKIWKKWMRDAPELFDDLDLVKDVLRIYSDEMDFELARDLHGQLNSLKHTISKEEVLQKYPVFRNAFGTNMLGGCMVVKGFTLKVQNSVSYTHLTLPTILLV